VTNTPPAFQTPPPTSLSVIVGQKFALPFSSILDVEGHTPTISYTPTGLTWIAITLTTLTITPTITE